MKCLYKLVSIINKRIRKKTKDSYSYKLYKNNEKLTIKIMEEAYEFCLEILKKKKINSRLISEFCDLLYHSIVGICSNNISIKDIEEKINNRMLSD